MHWLGRVANGLTIVSMLAAGLWAGLWVFSTLDQVMSFPVKAPISVSGQDSAAASGEVHIRLR